MAASPTFARRFEAYRATKTTLFWSCAVCVVATVIVGFNWGGWVTGGTATKTASDAAADARAHMAASICVVRFNGGPDAAAQLADLKKTETYAQGDLVKKNGWATMPGSQDPIEGAADMCAHQLVSTAAPPAKG